MEKELTLILFSFLSFEVLFAQNIGIGTTTPGARLEVSGFETTAHGKNAAISLVNTASGNAWFLRAGATGTATPPYGFSIADNGGYHFVIDMFGRIGIGETNPFTPLSFKSNTYGDKISFYGTTTNHFGIAVDPSLLKIYAPDDVSDIAFGWHNSTTFTERMRIKGNGNVGIGTSSPAVPLQFANAAGNKVVFFASGGNYYGIGTQTSLMQLYTPSSAEDIVFGYGNSTSFTENIRMDGTGSIAVKTNVTVQNGKGIIRSSDGTQQKKLSTTVTVNMTFAGGETKTIPITWPETFSGIPEAFVGNVVNGSGGWAEIVHTITGVTTTGATLWVYNPKTISVIPNYSIKIIAIGPQ